MVTGTSLWGELEVGTDVRIFPHDTAARVRRLHVHGDERSVVEAGERVAINLAGLSRETVSRGDQIIAPGPWEVTQLVTVGLELLATAPGPLDEGDEIEVHALAARVPARVDRLSVRPLASRLSRDRPDFTSPADVAFSGGPSRPEAPVAGQYLCRW